MVVFLTCLKTKFLSTKVAYLELICLLMVKYPYNMGSLVKISIRRKIK